MRSEKEDQKEMKIVGFLVGIWMLFELIIFFCIGYGIVALIRWIAGQN